MKQIIKVSHVSKYFKEGDNLFDNFITNSHKTKIISAVKDVSFNIKEGDILAIIGTNGAGKTTLLKLLTSLLIPDKGNIYFQEYELSKSSNRLKSEIGFMSSEERCFYWRLSIRGNLEFYAALYNMKSTEARARIEYLCEYLAIKDIERRFQECSTGIKQRCSLARSLLHNPSVLFMDEPTRSLDPVSASQIMTYIEHLARDDGKTIIFATHNTIEAEKIADEIMIMDNGRLLTKGSMKDIKNRYDNNDSLAKLFAEIIKKHKNGN